ncbi:YihY family inner membrane protein [Candidatus Vallotiella sp. (ex Adelges kitamiensis)]|uniref:YihY family inner membrane protein n=1 Tax=Candidatus Vallotiella sp. (ex Adelges kitamiensis) TaxID=2864217 RepID=UPI001CE34A67|nr:YihY family inner membrane protein [Candidatus Vallotia sp. (ex Adelges kitamiensis)]
MTKFDVDLDALKRLASFVARRSAEDRIPQVAGSLTFTTVLSLVPLATVAFALFTVFPLFASFQQSLQGFLADHLMPAQINSQIFKYLNQFEEKAKGLTTIGMITLVVTSVMTMMIVESAFNTIWRVRKSRPLAQRVLVYWAIITLGPLLIGVSLSASSYLLTHSMLANAVANMVGVASAASGIVTRVMPIFIEWVLIGAVLPLSVLAFTLSYVYLPNCRVAWRDAFIGGLCAAIAFECAKRGFGFYILRIPTYTAVYGAFATIPIFLLWVYLSWLITLFGAMLTSALPEIRLGHFHRVDYAGSDLLDALELLAWLNDARDTSRTRYTLHELARLQRCGLKRTACLLGKLEAINWIARIPYEHDSDCYVLVVNLRHASLRYLYQLFVIDRNEFTYQLNLDTAHVDSRTLLAALDHCGLDVSLATLFTARRLPCSPQVTVSPTTQQISAA